MHEDDRRLVSKLDQTVKICGVLHKATPEGVTKRSPLNKTQHTHGMHGILVVSLNLF